MTTPVQTALDTDVCVEDLARENQRLREAIAYYEIGVTTAGVPHPGERKVLHDCVTKAREIVAALTGKETS